MIVILAFRNGWMGFWYKSFVCLFLCKHFFFPEKYYVTNVLEEIQTVVHVRVLIQPLDCAIVYLLSGSRLCSWFMYLNFPLKKKYLNLKLEVCFLNDLC